MRNFVGDVVLQLLVGCDVSFLYFFFSFVDQIVPCITFYSVSILVDFKILQ